MIRFKCITLWQVLNRCLHRKYLQVKLRLFVLKQKVKLQINTKNKTFEFLLTPQLRVCFWWSLISPAFFQLVTFIFFNLIIEQLIKAYKFVGINILDWGIDRWSICIILFCFCVNFEKNLISTLCCLYESSDGFKLTFEFVKPDYGSET